MLYMLNSSSNKSLMLEGVSIIINYYSENILMAPKYFLLDVDSFSEFLKLLSLIQVCAIIDLVKKIP